MNQQSERIEDQIKTSNGVLTAHFMKREGVRNELLPTSAFIWIEWLKAEPEGQRLLRAHARAVINHVRARFGPLPVFLHAAANAPHGDHTSQEKLERYYRSCGFRSIGTSAIMRWPD